MARHGTHAEEYFYKVLIYNYLQKWGGANKFEPTTRRSATSRIL